jgi:hypothetical protein
MSVVVGSKVRRLVEIKIRFVLCILKTELVPNLYLEVDISSTPRNFCLFV